MKYVISWKKKQHDTTAAYEAAEKRVLDLVDGWKRPDGVLIHEFVLRAGDTGGFAVVETDDIETVHQAAAVFSHFNFHIDPVLDIDVAPAPKVPTVEWRDAVV